MRQYVDKLTTVHSKGYIVDFERIEKVRNNGETYHYYTLDNKKIPTVTEILEGFVPKPQLINWTAREAGLWAQNNLEILNQSPSTIAQNIRNNVFNSRDESAERGTRIHALVETILTQGNCDVAKEDSAEIKAMLEWLNAYNPKVIACEAKIFHNVLRYGGTLDLLCEIDGETWLIDLKTGKKIYNEVALQLSAYENATHIVLNGEVVPMVKVDKVGVLHLHGGELNFLEVFKDSRHWDLFETGYYFFQWHKKDSKKIFKTI